MTLSPFQSSAGAPDGPFGPHTEAPEAIKSESDMTTPKTEAVEKVEEASRDLHDHQCGSRDETALGATAALAERGETWPCPCCDGLDDERQFQCEACGGVGLLGSIEPIMEFTPCALGVGCDEAGVCFADAHGQPERCGRTGVRVSGATASTTPDTGTEKVAAQVEGDKSREELNTLLATLEARATAQAEEIERLRGKGTVAVAWRRISLANPENIQFHAQPMMASEFNTNRWVETPLYEAPTEVALPRTELGGWLKLADAPLGVDGIVWSPSFPDRNDLIGQIYAYSDGSRKVASSMASNVDFTFWHALPSAPDTGEQSQ